jgi:hypothetical protein
MAKRSHKLDESLFPVIPLRYKDFPLTNEQGNRLVACRKCEGHGSIATASEWLRSIIRRLV